MNIQTVLNKGKRFISDPLYRLRVMIKMGAYNSLSDEAFLKKMFPKYMGYTLNLDNPQTFSEKLQWMKLYDRKPIYTNIVDKYQAKQFLADKIDSKYIIPNLGVWDNFDEIDFDILPNQFVLKCTHDSGGIVICKDKSTFDKESARRIINRSLKRDYYLIAREWPYKNVPRRILAEEYIDELGSIDLLDYKMYSFHGEPKLTVVCSNRFSMGGTRMDYYDLDWNLINISILHYEPSNKHYAKPPHYEEMKMLCKQLSKDFPFLRVDFYDVNNHLYVGELTLYPGAGFIKIEPSEFDYKMGEWLRLESVHRS